MKAIFKNSFVRIAMLALTVFFLVMFVSLRLRQNELESRAEVLRNSIDEMNEYVIELQAELDRPFDEEYIAEIAHTKLGLRYPQEIIYYSGSEG